MTDEPLDAGRDGPAEQLAFHHAVVPGPSIRPGRVERPVQRPEGGRGIVEG